MDSDTLELDGHASQHAMVEFQQHSPPSQTQTIGSDLNSTGNNGSQPSQQTSTMDIDISNIKHEQPMVITPEIVTMMTSGHIGISDWRLSDFLIGY